VSLKNRSLVTIDDLSNPEIESVFSLADEMSAGLRDQFNLCQGKILASLFFEPSTRTRLSFETAMHRLGGRVISVMEIGNTSLSKGESIADMARVVGSYADIIAIRHPWEGAAKVVADYAGVPVINAGDGGHEHPSQTLIDLFTIRTQRKSLQGLNIALWGDLKYGRTVHSLSYALARFGANIHFRTGAGLGLPDHVIRKLTSDYGGVFERYDDMSNEHKDKYSQLDAIYVTPSNPHQLTNIPGISLEVEMQKGIDALYITRLQKERLESSAEGKDSAYPVVDKQLLKAKQFKDALVMHPLPRIDELAYEVDEDPRSMYFKQVASGVPIRMALIASLLGVKEIAVPQDQAGFASNTTDVPPQQVFGVSCSSSRCVTNHKTEKGYIQHKFKALKGRPLILRCAYCEYEAQVPYIASSRWHEGTAENKKYYSSDSFMLEKIKPENLMVFGSEAAAREQGFAPSQYAFREAKKH
jgi:aspartate carbamoyltransferase catalytic subunit